MRGRGIGSQLMEASKEYGIAHGADFIRTQVFPQNVNGLRFYEKNGFCEMMKTMAKSNIATGVVLIFLCVCIFGMGIKENLETKAFMEKAEETTGYVEEVKKERIHRRRHRNQIKYTATVKYTVDEKEYTVKFTAKQSSSRMAPFSPGESITIYYNPSNPKDARYDKYSNGLFYLSLVGIPMGIYFIVRGKKEL